MKATKWKIICYKKCTFVEGTCTLKDKELKQIVDDTIPKNVILNEINDLLCEKFETVNNLCIDNQK